MPKFPFLTRKDKSGSSINDLLQMGRAPRGEGQAGRTSSISSAVSNDGSQISTDGFDSRSLRQAVQSAASLATIDHTTSFTSPSHHNSHRNVKPSHQMLIAESMYEPSEKLNTTSLLSLTFPEALADSNILGFFIQFMEARDSEARHLMRFWIQAECFRSSATDLARSNALASKKIDLWQDAFRIYESYIMEGAPSSLNLNQEVRITIETKISEKKDINAELFQSAQLFTRDKMQSLYDKFLESRYFVKYEIDILTRGSVRLADVLFHDATLFYFIDFMEQEGMRSYVDFLLIAQNCRLVTSERGDAEIIYNRYFDNHSSSNLYFGESLRSKVERAVKEGRANCFEEAMAVLLQYFEKTYFRQFLESECFMRFLTDIINSLQNYPGEGTLPQPGAPRQRSTGAFSAASSESGATVDESLPSGDGHRSSNRERKGSRRQTELWSRELAGKLQIAHVDQYGKVTSVLEPEPDKPSSASSSLSKAMRRLVTNSADEKAKEEMAWQVAEMIVNDVCRITSENWE